MHSNTGSKFIQLLTSKSTLWVKRFCLVSHIFCKSIQPSSRPFKRCNHNEPVSRKLIISCYESWQEIMNNWELNWFNFNYYLFNLSCKSVIHHLSLDYMKKECCLMKVNKLIKTTEQYKIKSDFILT